MGWNGEGYLNMLSCEMKYKQMFALCSSLPAAFGRKTEQATVGSSFLNYQSWIHQKFSAWVLILNPVVMVPTWEGTIPSHSTSKVKQNICLSLVLLREVSCVWQHAVLFFHQHFLWFIENFPKKKQFVETDQNPLCVYTLVKQCGLFYAFHPAPEACGHLEHNNRQL